MNGPVVRARWLATGILHCWTQAAQTIMLSFVLLPLMGLMVGAFQSDVLEQHYTTVPGVGYMPRQCVHEVPHGSRVSRHRYDGGGGRVRI